MVPIGSPGTRIGPSVEALLVVASLPLWLVLFKLNGLYERDEERADHSTADDLFGVIQVVTLGVWAVAVFAYISGTASPELQRLTLFWLLTIATVSCFARICTRHLPAPPGLRAARCRGRGGRHRPARCTKDHATPRIWLQTPRLPRRAIRRRGAWRRQSVETLGGLDDLQSIVRELDVDRVFVAFSREPDAATMEVIRALRDEDVIIDVVPRLFELVGPRADVHSLEGLALVSVPSASLSRSSLLIKRAIDLVLRIHRTRRLLAVLPLRGLPDQAGVARAGHLQTDEAGMGKKPFTAYKFRTMKVDTDEAAHRAYVRSVMDASAAVGANGVYKLDRSDAITPFGRWLRKRASMSCRS